MQLLVSLGAVLFFLLGFVMDVLELRHMLSFILAIIVGFFCVWRSAREAGMQGHTHPFTQSCFMCVCVCVCVLFINQPISVTPALHTPLMSVTNAISGIVIVGSMIQLDRVMN